MVDDATLANAILDRIVHSAHRIILKGEWMGKKASKTSHTAAAE
jgi:hypothetical protein